MKNFVLTLIMILAALPVTLAAQNRGGGRLSHDEFMARQQEYLTKEAGLTEAEAKEFFPLYFQLQEQKQSINEQAWDLFRQGEDPSISEERYTEILDGFVEYSLSADRLEKSYLTKFRNILSSKKIYKVKEAEMKFRRELVKGMRPEGPREGRGRGK